MQRVIASSALVVGLVALALAGCGGGGGSSTGPSATGGSSGGAAVQGQIVRSQSAALEESTAVVVLRTALGVGVAEAAVGAPVANATVSLVDSANVTVASTTTDVNGNFLFPSVGPGSYTIRVTDTTVSPPVVLIVSPAILFTVGTGDTATIAGTVSQGTLVGQVTVTATDVSDLLQNDAQLCHAINIAKASHQNVAAVIMLRQSGMGWGQIAHTEGVSPSVIGLQGNCSPGDLDAASAAGGGPGNGHGHGKPS